MRPNPGDLILCSDGQYRMRQDIEMYLLGVLPPEVDDEPDEMYGPPNL